MRVEESIRFYLDTLSLNDHLMQWYRALFLTLEGILFTLAYVIIQQQLSQYLFIVALCGWLSSFLWAWVCQQRGRIVDRQKQKLRDLRKQRPDLDWDWFRIYDIPRELEKHLPRYTFNFFMPCLVGLLWAIVQWRFGPECGFFWLILIGSLVIVSVPIAYCILSPRGIAK